MCESNSPICSQNLRESVKTRSNTYLPIAPFYKSSSSEPQCIRRPLTSEWLGQINQPVNSKRQNAIFKNR